MPVSFTFIFIYFRLKFVDTNITLNCFKNCMKYKLNRLSIIKYRNVRNMTPNNMGYIPDYMLSLWLTLREYFWKNTTKKKSRNLQKSSRMSLKWECVKWQLAENRPHRITSWLNPVFIAQHLYNGAFGVPALGWYPKSTHPPPPSKSWHWCWSKALNIIV